MAIVEKKTIYRVKTNSDLNEGRGETLIKGFFLHYDTAKRAAKGQYILGTDCPIDSFGALTVEHENKLYLIQHEIDCSLDQTDLIRMKALAKLSAEEKEVLGIKE